MGVVWVCAVCVWEGVWVWCECCVWEGVCGCGVCAYLVKNAEFSHDLLLLLRCGPNRDDLHSHDGLGGRVQ